jgi:TolA-binding protein
LLLAACLLVIACLASFAAAAPVPTAAEKAFSAARQLYNVHLDAQAQDELQRFITTYPADPNVLQAQLWLGKIAQRQHKPDKALEAYGVVVKDVAPDSAKLRAEAYFSMAECCIDLKQLDKAVKSFQSCLKLATDADLTARAQYWIAECYYQQEKFPQAMIEYRRMTEIAPNHQWTPHAYYSIGDIELRQGHFPQAIAALEKVTTQYKDTAAYVDATLDLAFAYVGRARAATPPAGTADFQRAVTLLTDVLAHENWPAGNRQKAAITLGQTQFDLKQYSLAVEAYTKALALLDANSRLAIDTRLWRGHALYNNGNFAEALDEYNRVAASRYSDLALQANYWAGYCWNQVAQQKKEAGEKKTAYTEAIGAFRRYLAAPGDKPAANVSRATLVVAFAFEDLAGLGVDDAAKQAVDTCCDIVNRWPDSREAEEALNCFNRLAEKLTDADLRATVDRLGEKLPKKALTAVALRLARAEFIAGRFPEAINQAKKALDTKPAGESLAQSYYIIGASQYRLGALADAAGSYNQALAAATKGSDLVRKAQHGLTQTYLDQKQYTEALALARTLVTQDMPDKDKVEALMLLAEACLKNGRNQEAVATYQRIAKEFPTSPLVPNALIGMAGVAEATKDRALAINTYRDLIARFPDHPSVPEAFFHLGVNLAAQNEHTAAIDAFKNVPKAHPLADQAAYAIAWAYRDQGKHDEANDRFAAVAQNFPKSPLAMDSLFCIGEYWLERKDYDKAMLYYGRAQDIGGMDKLAPLVAYKLGVCAFYAGQYAVAADAFGKVIANYPTHEMAAESIFWRGQALEKQGQGLPAREAFTLYVTKYPKGALVMDATLGAGRAGVAAKVYPAARIDLQKALQLCADNSASPSDTVRERARNVAPEAQYYLAQSYFEEKKYDDALKQYAMVSGYQLEPWYSGSLLQMAECSALLGNKDAAEGTLALLLSSPSFRESDAVKKAPDLAKKYGLTIKQ